jgi:hypothetical protein
MNTLSLISLLLIPAGIVVSWLAAHAAKREKQRLAKKTLSPGEEPPQPKSGLLVLGGFAAIVVLFGIFTAATNWSTVKSNKDLIIFGLWLLVFMIFGMFAQVIVSNSKAGRAPFHVRAGELLLPLVVSPIVFYTIWTTVASAPKGAFVVYCAFLNGYFWEGTVSKAKPDGE